MSTVSSRRGSDASMSSSTDGTFAAPPRPAADDSTSAVKVYVRVRPFNERELQGATGTVRPTLQVADDKTHLTVLDPRGEYRPRETFSFDHCFWSVTGAVIPVAAARFGRTESSLTSPACASPRGPRESVGPALAAGGSKAVVASDSSPCATQRDVFDVCGEVLIENAFEGFNGCLFAYGQTGSGKTHTMMGDAQDEQERGVIPRVGLELFAAIALKRQADPTISFKVESSYFEVYNEKVFDLLSPGRDDMRVRQDPITGPFVEGLSWVTLTGADQILDLIRRGNTERHTAATKMNDRSSRSHAVLCVQLTQLRIGDDNTSAKVSSKINFVDLAGSERGAAVDRTQFREAAKINLSLTTLGRVIDALADAATNKAEAMRPPYRDSQLTWLLMDSLGGNSKTAMVATLSPSAVHFEETMSTLRYASRAREIINVVVVNEDPMVRRIKELTALNERLKSRLHSALGGKQSKEHVEDLETRLAQALARGDTLRGDLQSTRDALHTTQRKLATAAETNDKMSQRAMDAEASLKKARQSQGPGAAASSSPVPSLLRRSTCGMPQTPRNSTPLTGTPLAGTPVTAGPCHRELPDTSAMTRAELEALLREEHSLAAQLVAEDGAPASPTSTATSTPPPKIGGRPRGGPMASPRGEKGDAAAQSKALELSLKCEALEREVAQLRAAQRTSQQAAKAKAAAAVAPKEDQTKRETELVKVRQQLADATQRGAQDSIRSKQRIDGLEKEVETWRKAAADAQAKARSERLLDGHREVRQSLAATEKRCREEMDKARRGLEAKVRDLATGAALQREFRGAVAELGAWHAAHRDSLGALEAEARAALVEAGTHRAATVGAQDRARDAWGAAEAAARRAVSAMEADGRRSLAVSRGAESRMVQDALTAASAAEANAAALTTELATAQAAAASAQKADAAKHALLTEAASRLVSTTGRLEVAEADLAKGRQDTVAIRHLGVLCAAESDARSVVAREQAQHLLGLAVRHRQSVAEQAGMEAVCAVASSGLEALVSAALRGSQALRDAEAAARDSVTAAAAAERALRRELSGAGGDAAALRADLAATERARGEAAADAAQLRVDGEALRAELAEARAAHAAETTALQQDAVSGAAEHSAAVATLISERDQDRAAHSAALEAAQAAHGADIKQQHADALVATVEREEAGRAALRLSEDTTWSVVSAAAAAGDRLGRDTAARHERESAAAAATTARAQAEAERVADERLAAAAAVAADTKAALEAQLTEAKTALATAVGAHGTTAAELEAQIARHEQRHEDREAAAEAKASEHAAAMAALRCEGEAALSAATEAHSAQSAEQAAAHAAAAAAAETAHGAAVAELQEEHAAAIAAARAETAAAAAEICALRDAGEAERRDASAALAAAQVSLEKTVADADAAHAAAMAEVLQQAEAERASLTAAHATSLEEIGASHAAALSDAAVSAEKAMAAAEQRRAADLGALGAQATTALDAAHQAYSEDCLMATSAARGAFAAAALETTDAFLHAAEGMGRALRDALRRAATAEERRIDAVATEAAERVELLDLEATARSDAMARHHRRVLAQHAEDTDAALEATRAAAAESAARVLHEAELGFESIAADAVKSAAALREDFTASAAAVADAQERRHEAAVAEANAAFEAQGATARATLEASEEAVRAHLEHLGLDAVAGTIAAVVATSAAHDAFAARTASEHYLDLHRATGTDLLDAHSAVVEEAAALLGRLAATVAAAQAQARVLRGEVMTVQAAFEDAAAGKADAEARVSQAEAAVARERAAAAETAAIRQDVAQRLEQVDEERAALEERLRDTEDRRRETELQLSEATAARLEAELREAATPPPTGTRRRAGTVTSVSEAPAVDALAEEGQGRGQPGWGGAMWRALGYSKGEGRQASQSAVPVRTPPADRPVSYPADQEPASPARSSLLSRSKTSLRGSRYGGYETTSAAAAALSRRPRAMPQRAGAGATRLTAVPLEDLPHPTFEDLDSVSNTGA